MLYRKNIYQWEQWSRVVLGVGLIAGGAVFLPQPWGYVAGAAGAILAITGVFGWCPACAMVGRHIADRK